MKTRPRKLRNPNGRAVKARGRNFENAIVKVWHRLGWPNAKRNGAVYGQADRGDIGNVPLTVQCKAVDRIELWKHLDQARTQAENNGTGDETAVVYKRHESNTDQAAWVVPGAFMERLLSVYYSQNRKGGES